MIGDHHGRTAGGTTLLARAADGILGTHGEKKAIVVVAHALIVIVWHVLATGKPYHELGADYFTSRLDPERETRRLIARLEALGHQVSLQPAA